MDHSKKGEQSQGRGKGRAKKIKMFSSGGNFVSARRPGGLAIQKPDKNLEHQLLLENNMKSIVGAPKINPSLGKILTSRETNNKYLLTTKCNPAICANVYDRMVGKESKVTSEEDMGNSHIALPGLDEKASVLLGNNLCLQMGFTENELESPGSGVHINHQEGKKYVVQFRKWILGEVSVPTQTTIHPGIYPSQYLQQKMDPVRTRAKQERKKKAAKKRMSKVQKMQRAEFKEAHKFSNKHFLPKPECRKAEWEKMSKGVFLFAGIFVIADDAASNSMCSDSDLDETSDFETSEYETSEDEMSVDDTSEDEASDQNISEERSTAQKKPLKPISIENIPTWIDDSYPSDSYFQNANGEIFIVCDDSDKSSEDSDPFADDSDQCYDDNYYQNAFWEEYHSEDELSSSEEDEKPDVVLQPIQPAIKATAAEKDKLPAAILPSRTPASILPYDSRFIKDPKDVPFEEQCFEDEIDELYDEWATEQTMQLLSGEWGGPNILESVFGRNRDGTLLSEKLPRARGGAIEDDLTTCKVCRKSFKRLLKHLNMSECCAQQYDNIDDLRREANASTAGKRNANRAAKREALRAADEPSFKAMRADEKQTGRDALREKDEPTFKAMRAAEVQATRDALREKDEAALKVKMAAEKQAERDKLRAKDEAALKKKMAEEKRKQREKDEPDQFDLIRKFRKAVREGWSFSCVCCHTMQFDSQVVEYKEPLISQLFEVGDKVEVAIGDLDPKQIRDGKYYICHYCKGKLLKDKIPPTSHSNGLDLVDMEHHPELKLTPLENSLIARNIVFQKIVQLPKSRWSATKGKLVNVPINDEDVVNTMESLPRTPDEAQLICVELKRKLEYKNKHKEAYISVSKVEAALDTLYDLGHPHYQFVADMGGFEERCKEEEPLLSFDRFSDITFKKTSVKPSKKFKPKQKLDFENFFKSLRDGTKWPMHDFLFCINSYSFFFWGCRLDMTPFESEEFKSWPKEVQLLAHDPWCARISQQNILFWRREPKRILAAALANGWTEAKLNPGFEGMEEGMEWNPLIWNTAYSFSPSFLQCWVPKPENWYSRNTVNRNKAKQVGRRKAPTGRISTAILGEVRHLPDSWRKDKPWRHFNPITGQYQKPLQ